MSIIRIGLSETKHFADGYDAIFGKKTPQAKKAKARSKNAKKKKKLGKKK